MKDSKHFIVTAASTHSTEDTIEDSKSWTPQKKEVLILLVLMVISLMAALDATVLITVLPEISQKLNGSTYEAFWAGTSYLLTSAVSQPIFGLLSDFSGTGALTVVALIFFATGSIICALAQSFSVLLCGRFVQGVGGGGIITLVQIICAEMIPLGQRPRWFSLILLAWAIGTIAGPFLGSGLVQATSFRWVFWINVPFCGLSLVALPFGLPWRRDEKTALRELSSIDWFGCFLFALSMSSFLVGISWAGIQFAWSSYQSLVPIICGSCGMLGLAIWEGKYARNPFLRRSLFQTKPLCAAHFGAFMQGLILFCVLYYVPFYFAAVHLKSPMTSAVYVLPISCSMLPVSAITSHVISQRGSFRWAVITGWSFTVVGAGHLPLLDEETSTVRCAITFVVFGVGVGMTLCSLNFAIQATVEQQDAGKAASMYTFIRSVGMSAGVAVGGNVFQNVLASSLRNAGFSANIARDAERFISKLRAMDVSSLGYVKITHAYVEAFNAVFLVVAAVSGAGLLSSIILKICNRGGSLNPRRTDT